MKLAKHPGGALLAAILVLVAGAAQANCPVVSGYPESTPDSDFADAGNGMVRHIPTGLVWKRCAEGETWTGTNCTGTPATYSWEQSFARVAAVNAGTQGENAGQTDWRLPNINELKSLSELGCRNPAINTTQFPTATVSHFWSGSPVAGNSDKAWSVVFNGGHDVWSNLDVALQVRLVRAGQSLYSFDAAAAPAAAAPESIPTLSQWGMLLLSALVGFMGWRVAVRQTSSI